MTSYCKSIVTDSSIYYSFPRQAQAEEPRARAGPEFTLTVRTEESQLLSLGLSSAASKMEKVGWHLICPFPEDSPSHCSV